MSYVQVSSLVTILPVKFHLVTSAPGVSETQLSICLYDSADFTHVW